MNSNSKLHGESRSCLLVCSFNFPRAVSHITSHFNMLTNLQKLNILPNLLCLVAVNAVYTCGEQCNKEGKEKKVFAIFEAELALFKEQRGRWADVKEFTPAEFPKDSLRQTTKSNFITSEKIWERGMSMRRDLVNWLADYGKILNFTVLKPVVDENDPEAKKDQFDLELKEDSGGNADTEQRKILRKVASTRQVTSQRQDTDTSFSISIGL